MYFISVPITIMMIAVKLTMKNSVRTLAQV